MKIQNSQIWLWIITFIVFLIALGIFLRLYQSTQVNKEYIFHLWILIIAFFIAVFQNILSTLFSLLALKSIGQSTKYFPMLWITMLSTSANATVPFHAGMPIRAVLQKKLLNISYTASASAMLIETTLGYGGAFVIGLITGIIWLRPLLKEPISVLKGPLFVAFIIICVLITGCFVLWIIRRVGGGWLRHINNAAKLILNTKFIPLLGMILVNLITYIFSLLRFIIVLYAIGISVSPGPLFAALVFSYIAGVISFIPMGFGVRDVSLGSLLVALGVPLSYASAAAAIDRVLITLPYLIGGVFATHILGQDILQVKNTLNEANNNNKD